MSCCISQAVVPLEVVTNIRGSTTPDSCAYSSTGCRLGITLQLKRSPVFGVITGMGGLVGHACELGVCLWWPDGKMDVLDDVN